MKMRKKGFLLVEILIFFVMICSWPFIADNFIRLNSGQRDKKGRKIKERLKKEIMSEFL